MADKEILESTIDLSKVCITEKQKQDMYKILLKYTDVYSLRDKIGFFLKLELNAMTPLYIRPFPVKKKEKNIVDKEMRKRMFAWNLKKNLSSYFSPIMLIPKKVSGIPCKITDFRYLNARPVRLNCIFP